jgi:hypothetical protein
MDIYVKVYRKVTTLEWEVAMLEWRVTTLE